MCLANILEVGMTVETWFAFVTIWTLASIPLGPNAINCMSAAVSSGLPRAFGVVLGIQCAAICHALVMTFGFSAILLANAGLFTLLKLMGAAYILWLGVSLWRKRVSRISLRHDRRKPFPRLVADGYLVSMSNPKAILSYMAVFPQFIDARAPLAPQLLAILPTALGVTLAVYTGYTLAGLPLRRFLNSVNRMRLFNRVAGSLYVAFAVGLASSARETR